MKTSIWDKYENEYYDLFFDVCISGEWGDGIWRFVTGYDFDYPRVIDGGWYYMPPGESPDSPLTEAPPEVLAEYEKHKDELTAKIVAARMKG